MKITNNLFTVYNPKLEKSIGQNILSFGLTLNSYKMSMLINNKEVTINTCTKYAKKYNCIASCIDNRGQGQISNKVRSSRQNRTIQFFNDKKSFINRFIKELKVMSYTAFLDGNKPSFRANINSDIDFMCFPDIVNAYRECKERFNAHFYDYCKDHKRIEKYLRLGYFDFYQLVYSINAYELINNKVYRNYVKSLLDRGVSCSIVLPFTQKNYTTKHKLKSKFLSDLMNIECIDGDITDYRIEQGKIILLSYKGTNKELKQSIKDNNKIILDPKYLDVGYTLLNLKRG